MQFDKVVIAVDFSAASLAAARWAARQLAPPASARPSRRETADGDGFPPAARLHHPLHPCVPKWAA